MAENGRERREVLENLQAQSAPAEPPTIHYTELAEAQTGSPLYLEWNTYRREVGRLLEEGGEEKFVVIKDEGIIGVYDSHEAAMDEGYKRYGSEAFLVHQIREREPVLRVRGYNLPWPTSTTPLAKPA